MKDDQVQAITAAEKKQTSKEQDKEATKLSKAQGGDLMMHVKVYSPFTTYFDSQAFSISASNQTGPFDILPKHHNFISLLTECDVLVRSIENNQPKDTKIKIFGGIMHVKSDEVLVFLDV